jgi:hypothetical protein
MSTRIALTLGIAVLTASGLFLAAEEPKNKAKVELRWVERKPIKGVTEAEGIPASEAEGDVVYPHTKPALVLTNKEVSEAKFTKHDLTKNGLGVNYMVTLHLTKEARAKLAEGLTGKESRMITVTVDGKHWGWSWYVIDKDKRVSEQLRAGTFLPQIGYFSSEVEAQRIVDAFK